MPSDEEAPKERINAARLIAAVARRDRAAFAELFNFFAPRIKAFMRRSGMGDAAAEELAQEALLLVWRKASLFDPATTGAVGWIFTIARNFRIDAYRRETAHNATVAYDVDAEFQIDDTPQPDLQMSTAQSEARVRTALAQLSTDQVRVIELSFFEDKAHAEIAQALGIPLGTVKSRIRLAIDRLRKLLSEQS